MRRAAFGERREIGGLGRAFHERGEFDHVGSAAFGIDDLAAVSRGAGLGCMINREEKSVACFAGGRFFATDEIGVSKGN